MGGARLFVVALFVAIASLLSACGGDDSNDATTASTTDAAETSVVEESQAAVEKATAEVTEFNGPADSPPPAKDKTVYVLNCGPDTEGCARLSDASLEAAKAIGWTDSRVLRTDGSPQQMNAVMRQAIQEGADGIVIAAYNTAALSEPIAEAQEQGIPVIAEVSGDDPPDVGADFAGGLYAVVDGDNEQMGELAADWIIGETDGDATVGTFTAAAFPVLDLRMDGFEPRMEACEACELKDPIAIELTALAKDAAPATAQFLRANPDVNYMFATFDGGAFLAAEGIRTAGRDVPMVGTEGNSPNLDMIRGDGPEVAAVATPLEWIAWSGIDQMNRAFNGEPPAKEWMPKGGGIPLRIITSENAPPQGESYTGDLDFRSKFRELWGVGG